jgi:hypothetical protein
MIFDKAKGKTMGEWRIHASIMGVIESFVLLLRGPAEDDYSHTE